MGQQRTILEEQERQVHLYMHSITDCNKKELVLQVLELLKKMLPESVANDLKSRAGVIAKPFQEVSILFTDMKGFTAYSR